MNKLFNKPVKVYLTGPFFSENQIKKVELLEKTLTNNVTFLILQILKFIKRKKMEVSQNKLEEAKSELYKTFATYIRKYKDEFTKILDEDALLNLIKYF
ncbi:hypothetical protein [Lactococcus kimchii]|uniref:hypothetical protein n=1 Tax=Lactococcus sp. S-13 TaxID=2507158 RepID=UPI00268C0D72